MRSGSSRPNHLIDRPEVASRLGVSLRTVSRLVHKGYLEPVPVLGAVRYRESDVDRLVEQGTSGSAVA